ncbi:hypothetical protein [Rhizobium sp. CECT 9324]|uniref:hypothetical protein n=1 Tax=Rhizobium sp. CECT 9324 TaxID=2845820 RepID=UPI001E451992|nr:hypothetical protein [Rhizobium sp. CECT 9324]CAH0339634.1 hypothetical protein RHI9324_01285 [Rhizobium sp. CECT 9324]
MRLQLQAGSRSRTILSRTLLAFLMSSALSLTPALADETEVDQQIENLLGNAEVFKATIADLQGRIANEDSIAVSAFIDYPITVTINGKRKTLRQAEDLEPLYYDIFIPEITDVIVNQDYGSLFVNGDGVMFGNGEVWMNAVCLDDACNETEARIITIQAAD